MAITVQAPDSRRIIPRLRSADLVDILWHEAPFTSLPPDAPPELRKHVRDIQCPEQSLAVHYAARRHDFRTLVARFMFQLRKGCGNRNCETPSCFTCRMRLAGTKPVRRYSPTSARILAAYLAGCRNPYDYLCVGLRNIDAGESSDLPEPKRRGSLPFLSVEIDGSNAGAGYHSRPSDTGANRLRIQLHSRTEDRHPDCGQSSRSGQGTQRRGHNSDSRYITVGEQLSSKDHRSFAAATFETVAFKMVQWLAPNGIYNIYDAVSGLVSAGREEQAPSHEDHRDSSHDRVFVSHASTSRRSTLGGRFRTAAATTFFAPPDPIVRHQSEATKSESSYGSTFSEVIHTKASRRRSTGSLVLTTRFEGVSGPRRRQVQLPIDGRRGLQPKDGVPPLILKEKAGWDATNTARHVDIPASFAKRTSLDSHRQPHIHHKSCIADLAPTTSSEEQRKHMNSRNDSDTRETTAIMSTLGLPKLPHPQTLGVLNPAVVEFICNIYTEDRTAESHALFTSDAKNYGPIGFADGAGLTRRTPAYSSKRAMVWKTFNDQAIFSVLSDPHSLISSFTQDGKLMDSQTIWYCMVRLTRVMPDLAFHSLWLAAEHLLKPPRQLSHLRDDVNGQQQEEKSLTRCEASSLVSICLHALVAAVPVISDTRTLYELSRLRAGGQALPTSAPTVKQNPDLCLEYDGVFANELALRLARRLFLAIAARHRYDDALRLRNRDSDRQHPEALLTSLFTQLDFMNSETSIVLEFEPADRLLHETRVPTLLMDWARAVLMTNWDGRPTFSENTAFGGAILFMKDMYQRRNSLLLGDVQFRVDYFSDRLDSVEVPVTWVSPRAASCVGHLLDYPYLFTSDVLVSFFRSINFSRMSKTYEESSSLQTRMNAIVQPGSLITNPHHKFVLQDLLRTASAKYLILDIGRDNVLRDAFDQLWRREQRELLRPLKVHLGEKGGEEGFDSGGVQQEFFRMAVSECLDPTYGAFSVDERTRMAWFVPGSVVDSWQFELVGVLVSLALYNGLTLPVTFPKALYRKLLGSPVSELHHIADGWPDLVSGLTTLLEWDETNGLVEDVFARTYDFSISLLGRHISQNMKKDHESWPASIVDLSEQEIAVEEGPLVTNSNRDDYVSDYIRYLTDTSIRSQFEAFERGFKRCLCPNSLRLISPTILQSLVEGVQDIDVLELRRNTRYVGWDASHRTVKDFWSIVKKYDLDMRRRLLEFVTASDRVPVGGMRNMQFVVQKNGEEEGQKGRLPTAYTCYGTLLLPEYADKDTLRERLGMALNNAQGFGFA